MDGDGSGFPVVARGSKEECRAIESPAPCFLRDVVPPQLSSAKTTRIRWFIGFVQHVADFHRKRLDDSILA